MTDVLEILAHTAEEIRDVRIDGWANACDMAGDEIRALRAKLRDAQAWQVIETRPRLIDTTQPPFNGDRVMLWMRPEVGFKVVFGRYRAKSLWGPVWDFEDGHTVEAPAGALFWRPEPDAPTGTE
jgi:hypothetical protein